MPKAKNRVRDRRGERFPTGKRRLDPWYPLPPIGAVLMTNRRVGAFWGAIGPHTRVRVVAHTPEAPGNYGPGLKVVPEDTRHPLFRTKSLGFLGRPVRPHDVAIYVANDEIRTHVRPA